MTDSYFLITVSVPTKRDRATRVTAPICCGKPFPSQTEIVQLFNDFLRSIDEKPTGPPNIDFMMRLTEEEYKCFTSES